MKTRIDEIWTYLKNGIAVRAANDAALVESAYSENQSQIESNLSAALQALCVKAKGFIQNGEKGEVTFIVFSFLEASFRDGSHEIQVDAYDADFYLDLCECAEYLSYEYLMPIFDASVEALIQTAKTEFTRFTLLDEMCIREQYKSHLKEWLREHIMRSFASDVVLKAIAGPCISNTVTIMCGQYLSNQEVLLQVSEGN